jgi:hypothetical protein
LFDTKQNILQQCWMEVKARKNKCEEDITGDCFTQYLFSAKGDR